MVIQGPNGCGKSTLIKLLNGIIFPMEGSYTYEDHEITEKALKEMYRQVGENQYNEKGILQKGMIIRHLVLPNNIENSKQVLKWIKENMPETITISLMAQYFPTYKAKQDSEINRKLTQEEYNEIEEYLYELEIENGYIQDLEDEEEKYVPKF